MRTDQSKATLYVAMAANIIIAVSKFLAAFFTGSSSMLSEGIHSVIDTGNQLLLLLGIHKSQKPADSNHPFGYGKELYFWSLIVAIIIFAIGGGVSIYEGIMHIQHENRIKNPLWNYIVLGIAFISEGTSFQYAYRHFRSSTPAVSIIQAIVRSKDPASFIVLIEDFAALTGLVIAFLGVSFSEVFELYFFDGIASLCIGILLACTALFLARESKNLLIGESAGKEFLETVTRIVGKYPQIKVIGAPLSMYLGANQIVLAVQIDIYQEKDLEGLLLSIEREIKNQNAKVQKVFFNFSECKK